MSVAALGRVCVAAFDSVIATLVLVTVTAVTVVPGGTAARAGDTVVLQAGNLAGVAERERDGCTALRCGAGEVSGTWLRRQRRGGIKHRQALLLRRVAAEQKVVARAAVEHGVARSGGERVVAGAGHQRVVAGTAVQEQVERHGRIDLDHVIAGAAFEGDLLEVLRVRGDGQVDHAELSRRLRRPALERVQVVQRRLVLAAGARLLKKKLIIAWLRHRGLFDQHRGARVVALAVPPSPKPSRTPVAVPRTDWFSRMEVGERISAMVVPLWTMPDGPNTGCPGVSWFAFTRPVIVVLPVVVLPVCCV